MTRGFHRNSMSWFIYIIECSDSKFYTGITNNLDRRIKAHNSGNGGRFTKVRTPVKLLYSETVATKPAALKRELKIKQYTRQQKFELIKSK